MCLQPRRVARLALCAAVALAPPLPRRASGRRRPPAARGAGLAGAFVAARPRGARGPAVWLPRLACRAGAGDPREAAEAAVWPSVSVQVITYKRPRLLAQALDQLRAQDYPGPVEILVVDDSPESAESVVACHSNARYFHLQGRHHTIGEKRNLAVAKSHGDIVCIWDDDDIFPVDRIRQQVSRMIARAADCSSIQIAFAYSMADSRLSRCLGLPLPFENSFCFRRGWLSGRRFDNSSSGEGIALFEGLSDWYGLAQPITGEELPFLYIRTLASTAPDDALELHPVESALGRDGHGARVDRSILALARAFRRGRFPDLGVHPGGAAVGAARARLRQLVRGDVATMRSDVGGARRLAPRYWQGLGGSPASPPAALSAWGPAGEAPEGPMALAAPPPRRATPGAADARGDLFAAAAGGPTSGEALGLIAAAAEEI